MKEERGNEGEQRVKWTKDRGRRTGGSRGYRGVGFMNTDWAVTAFTAVNVTTSLAVDGQRTSHPQE